MTEHTWRRTTADVYRAIYDEHRNQLVPYATHTCMEGCEFHGERFILTEWCLQEGNVPLIRSIGRGDPEEWTYYILEGRVDD